MSSLVKPSSLAINVSSAAAFLVITHAAGVIGLSVPSVSDWFRWATPFQLLLTAGLLLYFHRGWQSPFKWWTGITVVFGYLIEVIGVKTSLIFGDYQYGATLGFKLWEVPPVIGINWFIMAYVSGMVASQLPLKRFFQIIMAALLMVGSDFLIEPVAIRHDFWYWSTATVPVQNYLGWLIAALLLQSLFFLFPFRKENALAQYVLVIQLAFFMALQVFDQTI